MTFSFADAKGQTAWRSASYPLVTAPVTPELQKLEATMSAALLAWSALPEGPRKAELWDNLSELLGAWQGLSRQMAVRDTLTAPQYAGLLTQAGMLRNAAEGLKAEITP